MILMQIEQCFISKGNSKKEKMKKKVDSNQIHNALADRSL